MSLAVTYNTKFIVNKFPVYVVLDASKAISYYLIVGLYKVI